MKIMLAFGTRACAIKMTPLINESIRRGHETIIVWSGQHFSPELFKDMFNDLGIRFPPDYDIGVKGSPNEIGSKILTETEKICEKEKPDIVLIHGDTYSSMFFAIGSTMSLVPIGHVEAGLRTNSWEPFPEQICTRTTDACSALYFAPTERNKRSLLNEGFPSDRIFVTGNTIVDVCLKHSALAKKKSNIIEKLDVKHPLIYLTVHRKENFLNVERIKNIFDTMLEMKDVTFYTPTLPSTQNIAEKLGYTDRIFNNQNIIWKKCTNYTDHMRMMLESDVCVTDSGGMQEECCVIKLPCLTLRYVTDRPESVNVGINKCIGMKKDDVIREITNVLQNVKEMKNKIKKSKNPYGDGTSSKQIINIIEKFEGKLERWENKVINL